MYQHRLQCASSQVAVEERNPAYVPVCLAPMAQDWTAWIYARAMEMAVQDVKAQVWRRQLEPSLN